MSIFVDAGYTVRNCMIFSIQMGEYLSTSEKIAIFEEENIFLVTDVFIQPPENHILSDEDSGGEDPDPNVIRLEIIHEGMLSFWKCIF